MATRNRFAAPTGLSGATVGFKSVQLFKDDTLGIGSYGKVCRAKCDQLPCAAKIIHETLFDPTAEQLIPRGREHRLPFKRFEQECEFLNTIRHPNVIQYLGMCRDPDTGLPVLLMELMDDNLTHFLETATQQIPYHVQVNICHDIAMALTFLHANGIVHRDLSSNNVLMISNVRAKVTDFGMAKLGDLNPQTSRLTFTMCPGTDVYMPPEAVQDQPVYTEKIDCFSFGVIIVQMLTRQFPKPGDRMQRLELNHPGLPRGTLMVCIPEIDRRQNHISQVDPNHPLLPISLDCLKDKDVERPSAEQLCERVAALKEQSKYTESTRAAQANESDLRKQIQSQREEHIRETQKLIDSHTKSLTEKYDAILFRNMEIAARDEAIATREKEIADNYEAIQTRDREIQQLREQLEQITLRMSQRDETREPFVERRIQSMVISNRQECAPPADIKLKWRMVAAAPEKMCRSCNAAVSGSEIYFNVCSERTMYSYNVNSELWSKLPDCPNECSSFAAVDNLLTAIGGISGDSRRSNKLHSLKQQPQGNQWVEEFPPMLTKRSSTTSICTRTDLIVAGGTSGGFQLTCVEVMNTETHQWSIAADLPSVLHRASGVVCGNHLYLVGGYNTKSTYSCSLSDLLQSCQSVLPAAQLRSSNTTSVWRKLADLPDDVEYGSTAVLINDQLLAIGGSTDFLGSNPSKKVYMYKPATNSWKVVSQMSVARCFCFAVTLPTNKVMVVGGYKGEFEKTDTAEIAEQI